jgi:aerobic C4-dicarboxylate transport protein
LKILSLINKNSFIQIILAIAGGVLFGLLFNSAAKDLKVVADCYIQLIKMVINPLLFISVVLGVCSHNRTKITRLAVKTLIYFEILSAVAILLTFGIMILFHPGTGFPIPNLPSFTTPLTPSAHLSPSNQISLQEFVLSFIPSNFFGVLAGNNLIAVLVLALLFAVSIRRMKSNYEKVVSFFEISSQVFYQVIGIITKLAPIAAFAAFAASVSEMGLETI